LAELQINIHSFNVVVRARTLVHSNCIRHAKCPQLCCISNRLSKNRKLTINYTEHRIY